MNKETFTARYDPNTDKILGCTKGSKEYYHEERHRQQYSIKIIRSLDFIFTYIRYMFLGIYLFAAIGKHYTTYRFFFVLFLTGVLVGILFEFMQEMDAEAYSWRKTKNESKGKKSY
jgi:VanZ family protein